MSAPGSFEDLNAWQSARALTKKVYRLCRRAKRSRDFGLCDPLRRAAVSVMNNLAEGWESLHLTEKRQLYHYARRSCGEARSMSHVLLDDELLSTVEQQDLLDRCVHTGKLIAGLIGSLDRSA